MVSSFLIPHVEQTILKQKSIFEFILVVDDQRKYLLAAHKAVYKKSTEVENVLSKELFENGDYKNDENE